MLDDSPLKKQEGLHYLGTIAADIKHVDGRWEYVHRDYFAREGPTDFSGIRKQVANDGMYTIFSMGFEGPQLIVREGDRMMDTLRLPGYRFSRKIYQSGADSIYNYVFCRNDLLRQAEMYRNWEKDLAENPDTYPSYFNKELADQFLRVTRFSLARLRRDYTRLRLYDDPYPESWLKPPEKHNAFVMRLCHASEADIQAAIVKDEAEFPARVARYERMMLRQAEKVAKRTAEPNPEVDRT